MQSIYNRIEVAFTNVDLSIFEKQNLMPLYNKLNNQMYVEWDNLPPAEKEYYNRYTVSSTPPPYQFRYDWIQKNLEKKEEYKPIIEAFKSYYNL